MIESRIGDILKLEGSLGTILDELREKVEDMFEQLKGMSDVEGIEQDEWPYSTEEETSKARAHAMPLITTGGKGKTMSCYTHALLG